MKSVSAMLVKVGIASLALGIMGACASGGRCNTDSCYRELASKGDAFEQGEVVAWGVTEKQGQDEQRKNNRDLASEKVSK